ncbi:MAG TPA: 50S ribosomal protein L23 [Candidatus Saccharimonadales bacterium]|jgi:large subunit ribosomal protein L23
MSLSLLLIPRVSEKAYGLSQVRNTYVFDVERAANKHSIARAVEAQYKVTVTEVNTINAKGKSKRTVRKGGRPTMGRTSDVKKAYVTLKAGDSMPIFTAIEEASAKEAATNEKLAKVAEKAAAKQEKSAAKQAKKEAKEGDK